MNLKNMTESRQKSGKPSISITKSGVIRFSSQLTRQLDLKAGMQVAIFQDQDTPSDWYLKLNEPGLTLRGNVVTMLANNATVCRGLLEVVGEEESASMLVGTTPIDGYYAIITHSAKTKTT